MEEHAQQYKVVKLTSIKIGERHRKEYKGIEELAESINKHTLLHPIVITAKNELVAGGRRLAAMKLLGFQLTAVHYLEDLSKADKKLIELEENIKRADLTWQEECLAVKEFHDIKSKTKDWTLEKTAREIGLVDTWISRRILVAEAILALNPGITDCVGANAAYNILTRQQSRVMDEAFDELETELEHEEAEEVAVRTGVSVEVPESPSIRGVDEPAQPYSALEADFQEWAQTYSGPRFNFIHCDFPYGISLEGSEQAGASSWEGAGRYGDSLEVYRRLLAALRDNIDNIAAPACHLMFWFSFTHRNLTYGMLKAGSYQTKEMFALNTHPLIWVKSDGRGILPDPNRGPRQVYESALFGTRGDRKIVKAVANAFVWPQGQKQHLSEKPAPVLEHFFRMIVDENTRILDPTCGSGTALAVAKQLGAKYVLGLDNDPASVKLAARNLRRSGNDEDIRTE